MRTMLTLYAIVPAAIGAYAGIAFIREGVTASLDAQSCNQADPDATRDVRAYARSTGRAGVASLAAGACGTIAMTTGTLPAAVLAAAAMLACVGGAIASAMDAGAAMDGMRYDDVDRMGMQLCEHQ